MVKAPTVREDAKPEHHRAKWWRQHVACLSIDQLAEATGYSSRAVYLMELGIKADGKRVSPWVWKRYKLACAAVHLMQRAGKPFDWPVQ